MAFTDYVLNSEQATQAPGGIQQPDRASNPGEARARFMAWTIAGTDEAVIPAGTLPTAAPAPEGVLILGAANPSLVLGSAATFGEHAPPRRSALPESRFNVVAIEFAVD